MSSSDPKHPIVEAMIDRAVAEIAAHEASANGAPVQESINVNMLDDLKGLAYESITSAKHPESGAMIRIWRKSDILPIYPDMDLVGFFNGLLAGAPMLEIVKQLVKYPNVTRVELLDGEGIGAAIYFGK